jgi:ABC-type Zn uptake system ZnuABC Zn-binding protein ZnuA
MNLGEELMRKVPLSAAFCVSLFLAVVAWDHLSGAASKNLGILAGTFPVYLFTRNIAAGVEGVEVRMMLPPDMGCPHDYVLTPADMEKIRGSDVFVANGLGLEEFLGDPLIRANPDIEIIDSSRGIEDLIPMSGHDHPSDPHHGQGHDHDDGRGPAQAHGGKRDMEHGHGHGHAGEGHEGERGHPAHPASGARVESVPNPHIFASPLTAARMVENIADALIRRDPSHTDIYRRNADAYKGALMRLSEELKVAAGEFKSRRIVTHHAVFDYLARDVGLEIVAVVQEEPGQEPSAAEMLRLVRLIKETGAAAVFTEPQYPSRVGEAIAREAGIPVAVLDPVASGPGDAPPDYYQTVMRNNLETLKRTLGRAGS